MRTVLIFLSMTTWIISCNNRNVPVNEKKKESLKWNSKFEVFDEPNSRSISEMKYYLLLVSENFMDSLSILSIRQDSNYAQGFYKKVAYNQKPALFPNQPETKTFKYSTIRFLLQGDQIDSIKKIVAENRLFSLRDSIEKVALDGSSREIVAYTGGYNL